MNKNWKPIYLLYAVAIIVFNVIFFVVPFEKTPMTWVAYGFTWLAIFMSLTILIIAQGKAVTLRSHVYGLPVAKVGLLYAVAQFVFALIVITVLNNAPIWVIIVIEVILLGAASVGVILTDTARNVIETQEENDRKTVQNMKYMTVRVQNMINVCDDASTKKNLQNMYELFRYSDPVSNQMTADVEDKILGELTELEGLIGTDNAGANAKIQIISKLVEMRKNFCIAGKQ